MRPRTRVLLEDVRQAAAAIKGFVAGRSLGDYDQDLQLRSAVERQFEIIGEALAQLSRSDPAAADRITAVERIVAFRNILAHAYRAVVDAVVWDIIQDHLPRLREEAEARLREAGP